MRSIGLLLLRVVVGGMLAAQGFPKLFGGPGKQVSGDAARILGPGFNQAMERGGFENTVAAMERMEMPSPRTMAGVAAGAEFFGGLALILGWRTRLASLVLLGTRGLAFSRGQAGQGLMGAEGQPGAETPLLYLAALTTLFVAGPGKLSLDRG